MSSTNITLLTFDKKATKIVNIYSEEERIQIELWGTPNFTVIDFDNVGVTSPFALR